MLFFYFFDLLSREYKLSSIHYFYTTIFTNCFTRILVLKDMYSNWSMKHGHLSKLTVSEIEKPSKYFLMEMQSL